MDIADQFKQIGVFLAEKGFVTILEQMAAAIIARALSEVSA
jgi:hypothetical protein